MVVCEMILLLMKGNWLLMNHWCSKYWRKNIVNNCYMFYFGNRSEYVINWLKSCFLSLYCWFDKMVEVHQLSKYWFHGKKCKMTKIEREIMGLNDWVMGMKGE